MASLFLEYFTIALGKILGIIFGISLIFLFGVLVWRVYPEEVIRFIPPKLFDISSKTEKEKKIEIETGTKENSHLESSPEELKDVDALLERGNNFLSSRFLSLAINDFSRAADISPKNRNIWINLIKSQISFRDYSSAESSAKKAISHFPNDQEFLIFLGEIYIQKSDFDEAQSTFLNMPESPARNFYLGVLTAYFENYEETKRLLQVVPKDSEFGKQAAILLGTFDEFSLFPEGNPLHLRLLITKAFNNLRFFEMAVQSSKKIIQEQENYRDAWVILGHSYLSLERYDLAKNILEKALELDPTKPETAFFLGLSETALEDYDSAITHLSMARENGYAPQTEVTTALATAFLSGKFYDAARKEFEKLLDVQGAPIEKYVQPIQISIEFLKDPKSAQILAQKAIKNYPDSDVAKNLLAWALLEDEKLGEARELLNEIIAKSSDFAPAHLNLGRIAEKEEKYEEALEEYLKAYELSPHTEIGSIAAQNYNVLVLRKE